MPHPTTPETAFPDRTALCRHLAEKPDDVLEMVAEQARQNLLTVTECLPERYRAFASGHQAEEVMTDIAEWGPVTVLVHTADLILECKGALPRGKFGRGYFNLMGHGPIGGHIRLDRCAAIGFVRRPFMGADDSCSVVFFNQDGDAMFKIFVGRDDKRCLLPDQVDRFTRLQQRLCPAATA